MQITSSAEGIKKDTKIFWQNGDLYFDGEAYHWTDFWHDHNMPMYQSVSIDNNYRLDHLEIAFKMISKLMEKGFVKEMDIGTFIRLVNDMAELIIISGR